MNTLEFYKEKVQQAEKLLSEARTDLRAFIQSTVPVFDTLEDAEDTLCDELCDEASEDCEGSHNYGAEVYTRDFIVEGILYTGTLTVEYGRYDKTYYFVDGSKFTYEKKKE